MEIIHLFRIVSTSIYGLAIVAFVGCFMGLAYVFMFHWVDSYCDPVTVNGIVIKKLPDINSWLLYIEVCGSTRCISVPENIYTAVEEGDNIPIIARLGRCTKKPYTVELAPQQIDTFA